MEWVETTGRTVEDAKEAALDQLGVDDADAEFVVVSEPKVGLFGRTRGEARVRARVRPTRPRPKRTRSRSQGEREGSRSRSRSGARGGSRTGGGGGGAGAVAVAEAAGTGTRGREGVAAPSENGTGMPRKRRPRSGAKGGSRSTTAGTSGDAADRADRADETVDGDAVGAPVASTRGKRTRSSGATKEAAVGEDLSLEEQGEAARKFVAGLVQELGLGASVSTRSVDDETVEVAVDGAELGVLVGPGGATLGALQELARTYVQKRTGGQSGRILVDVAGYRAKRAAALQRFARQIAEEVLETGDERALEPMSAPDRKVVHDAVNEIEGLATRSEGEEPRRYIVISLVAGEGRDGDAVEA